ncbi:hypothetical protein EV426DRAFT_721796 [Tirmania nivea]|nr:hypothetical protein EV426DRAFT_721796 [Tirmania nivea]
MSSPSQSPASPLLRPLNTSSAPLSELVSHHDRDLRARTLTSLLAALSPITDGSSYDTTAGSVPIVSTKDGAPPWGTLSILQESPRDSSTNASQTWLKLLNHVAQLLVREHEIVAVLPKRSGPTAHVNLLIASDSSGDDDPMDSVDGYLIARNPRFDSPEPSPGNPVGKLIAISSQEDMLQYLHTYRHVSYRNHVLCIEVLFNAIVDAWNTYTAVLDDHDPNSTAAPVEEAHNHFILRKKLLNSFVTFYSVGKMRRRFLAKPFVRFRNAMSGMWQAQVEGAFGVASRPDERRPFTNVEIYVFEALLADRGADAYPGLSATLAAARANATEAFYTKDTAWDLHRLLLSVLDSAQSAVDTLFTQIALPSTSCLDLSRHLSDVLYSMGRLHFMVHRSPSISTHMKTIEPVLSKAIDTYLPEPKPAASRGRSGVGNACTGDLDQDDGVTDTTIEISLAHKEKRVGEACLWLAVRYQAALQSLTAEDTLPNDRVTLTLCEISGGDKSKTDLHDWKDVMRSIYPSRANSADANARNANISCEEAIETLQEWAKSEGNRVLRETHILRKLSHEFYGRWHAEAILATLKHLSQLDPKKTTPPGNINLAPFEHTFNSIGVSKRCCPICTKLLLLLGRPPTTSDGNEDNGYHSTPSMVFSSHQNIYPTALPPYLPRGIAFKLLVWLEEMVKRAVEGLVLKRRSRESEGTQKAGRDKSADSAGESPGRKVRRKRAKEPGSEFTDVMRELGF